MLKPATKDLIAYENTDFSHTFRFRDLDLTGKTITAEIWSSVKEAEFTVAVDDQDVNLVVAKADQLPRGTFYYSLIIEDGDHTGGQVYIIGNYEVRKSYNT